MVNEHSGEVGQIAFTLLPGITQISCVTYCQRPAAQGITVNVTVNNTVNCQSFCDTHGRDLVGCFFF